MTAGLCGCPGDVTDLRGPLGLLLHGHRVTCTRCGRRTFAAAWIDPGHACRECVIALQEGTP